MRERHPFGMYIPKEGARYLLLGSFPGRGAIPRSKHYDPRYDWYYSSRRGQFWRIMEAVYGVPLKDKDAKRALADRLGLALGDVIESCTRMRADNADTSLRDLTYNTKGVARVLATNDIETIFFTSNFVAQKFKTHFKAILSEHPDITFVTLPSPSPRYARMTKLEKIREYRQLLPRPGRGSR